ncbi:MAG TPA: septum formation family protein [Actinophytocola sp.]|uniref:septum formation family protein n=1 Tax=Actinophytocola sp. TaxID=1872138 RepID=UPI002DBDAB8F|nr:septum formation family protein [Actinophytocola sp.]HEU5473249.1 septum formation family protein [Actinophytocola sp.]
MAATETIRTRLVMAGAFVGALALLSATMLFSWPVSVPGASSSTEDEATAAFDAPAGTCLTWPTDNPRALDRIDCGQPHIFELTGSVEISADNPESAPPPDDQAWQQIANDKCTPNVTEYLGGALDPFGRFSVSALKPTDDQWREGDRKLRCGVHRVTATGTRLPTTGSAAGQDQSNVFDPGTCFALTEEKGVGDPTECEKTHAIEVVGNVDLSQAFPAEYPQVDAQQTRLAELCALAASQYSGGVDLAAKKLTLGWDPLEERSWAAGSRKVDCRVGSRLPDGSGLAPISGTLKAAPPAGDAPPAEQPPPGDAPPPSTSGG